MQSTKSIPLAAAAVTALAAVLNIWAPSAWAETKISEWQEDVVYQVMVDRFYDADASNNIPQTSDPLRYRNGDLKGVIAKLDYVKNLGATAILLNPIVKGRAYHGYSVTDPVEVDPHYGSLDDYRELLRQAHARGMKVIFDLVLNHVHWQSPVFQQHPSWFRPPTSPEAVNDSLLDEVWPRLTFYGLPDFDQDKEDVYQYLLGVAKFWIALGVDGFRFDAVTLGHPRFWSRLTKDIAAVAPSHFLLLGEIFTMNQERLNRYLDSFNAYFDFPLYQALIDVVLRGEHPYLLKSTLSLDSLYRNSSALPFTFVDNHDLTRLVSRAGVPAQQRLKLALGFLLTRRGVPTILYGTEIGLHNDPTLESLDWDRSRSSMKFQRNEENPLFIFLKQMLAVRRKFKLGSGESSDFVDRSLPDLWISAIKTEQGKFVIAAYNFSSHRYSKVRYRLSVPGLPADAKLAPLLEKSPPLTMLGTLFELNLQPFDFKLYSVEPRPKGEDANRGRQK